MDLTGSQWNPVVESCEHNNKALGSIKEGNSVTS
jgi:hypothetical protein